MMKDVKALIILTLAGLCASFQTACATPSQIITKTEILTPPSVLLLPCTKPKAYNLKTNQDLAHFASSIILAWESCAAQVDALRDFYGIGYSDLCPQDKDAVITQNDRCLAVCKNGNSGPCFINGVSLTPCFDDDGTTALCDAEWIELDR